MTYCFDLDGVICDTQGTAYDYAIPNWEVIRQLKWLVMQGHTILLYTARGVGTGVDWGKVTYEQLSAWGVPYTKLYMTKPPADVYVDDKAQNIVDFMKEQHNV